MRESKVNLKQNNKQAVSSFKIKKILCVCVVPVPCVHMGDKWHSPYSFPSCQGQIKPHSSKGVWFIWTLVGSQFWGVGPTQAAKWTLHASLFLFLQSDGLPFFFQSSEGYWDLVTCGKIHHYLFYVKGSCWETLKPYRGRKHTDTCKAAGECGKPSASWDVPSHQRWWEVYFPSYEIAGKVKTWMETAGWVVWLGVGERVVVMLSMLCGVGWCTMGYCEVGEEEDEEERKRKNISGAT